MGVGVFIAGGDANEIRGNRIWDNWRRGTMLLHVPDSLSDEKKTTANSTSHRNRYHDNVMGIAPNGAKVPNGVDFWWDEAPNQEDNCWFDNGDATTDPPAPLMPSNCDNTSAGVTYPGKLSSELLPCAGAIAGNGYDPNTCPWFRTPPKPSGDSDGGMGLPVQASGAEPFGVALQVADCQDWRDSSPQERQSAIDQLERTVAGPRKDGNTLEDDVAYSTLDSRCKPDFARGFLLYQLYIRAAAFTPPTE